MRKLVFHLFITKDWRENVIYNIHFKCLEYYKDCWDKAYFALSLEDPEDTSSLTEIKQKLILIFDNLKDIEFETIENTIYFESDTFKKQVVERLGQDDLVFFSHIKGIRDAMFTPLDKVIKNICALYYFSLNPEKEIQDVSYNLKKSEGFISYGSLMVQFDADVKTKGKYNWIYAGSFFWINSKRLNNFINNNNLKLPDFDSRFYSENFLCNIFPIHLADKNDILTAGLATSYCAKYIISTSLDTPDINNFISYFIEGEEEKYNNFINMFTSIYEN